MEFIDTLVEENKIPDIIIVYRLGLVLRGIALEWFNSIKCVMRQADWPAWRHAFNQK